MVTRLSCHPLSRNHHLACGIGHFNCFDHRSGETSTSSSTLSNAAAPWHWGRLGICIHLSRAALPICVLSSACLIGSCRSVVHLGPGVCMLVNSCVFVCSCVCGCDCVYVSVCVRAHVFVYMWVCDGHRSAWSNCLLLRLVPPRTQARTVVGL